MSGIEDKAREAIETFLHELDGWESAYPLRAFPEPDLKRVGELLKAGGQTLDAVSASNMRHVVSCIAPSARKAIDAAREQGRLAALDEAKQILIDRAFGRYIDDLATAIEALKDQK